METFFMEPKFDVLFMEDAREFLANLDPKSRQKIIYNIDKARILNNQELFKKLHGEIWEFRTLFNKTYYRLFAFWDTTDKKKTLVISTHGIIKKADKIPITQIAKANQLMHQYFTNKL